MLTHTYELGPHSMPAPLHSYSVSCAHAHIRVGLAINACPSTLVFSHWCSRTYTSWASKLCRPLYTRIQSPAFALTYTSWASNQCTPLYTRIQCLVLKHTYELGQHSVHAPLHSYSATCAHAHIRVGLAINACPSTLVFSHLCARTYTSWASNPCLPLYTRLQ